MVGLGEGYEESVCEIVSVYSVIEIYIYIYIYGDTIML